MPRKTLALISGLVLITVILFVVALRSTEQKKQLPTPSTSVGQQPSPTSAARSVLTLSPNPVSVLPGRRGEVEVNINTFDNAVTAVQLEIGYDPTLVNNVQVTPGPLFAKPVVLINKNNPQQGRMTYALGITPTSSTVTGTGVVAKISFTARGTVGKETQLSLLPTTLVTARGVASSVLQSSTGTLVKIGATTTTGTSAATNPAVTR